jgi:hypothetical protein
MVYSVISLDRGSEVVVVEIFFWIQNWLQNGSKCYILTKSSELSKRVEKMDTRVEPLFNIL